MMYLGLLRAHGYFRSSGVKAQAQHEGVQCEQVGAGPVELLDLSRRSIRMGVHAAMAFLVLVPLVEADVLEPEDHHRIGEGGPSSIRTAT